MYKLIIFDLDGTLLDTLPDICAVLCDSLRKFNLKEITLADTKKFVGNGAETLVRRAVGNSDKFDEVYRDYSINFAESKSERTALFDGESAVLKKLNALGIKLAVISNKPQIAAERVVNKFFKDVKFDFVIGQSERYPLKPDPTSTLDMINLCNFEKSECVFVGDGETDVQTAKNAGIDCVSVLWGYRSREQLERAEATSFACSWEELYGRLTKN